MSIIAKNVGKAVGTPSVQILDDINLEIQKGDFVALTGRSGSGKSTLLYLLGSLDTPSNGLVSIDGADIAKLSSSDLARFRNEKMGFVFQFHYLIAELTALENVLLPAQRSGQGEKRKAYAEQLLERVGLAGKFHRLPRQLSGGEQQRVAIARSLVMEPAYLFADEPTGALDSVNGEAVMKMLLEANQEKKTTIVLVTHDPDFAASAKRAVHMADGKLVNP